MRELGSSTLTAAAILCLLQLLLLSLRLGEEGRLRGPCQTLTEEAMVVKKETCITSRSGMERQMEPLNFFFFLDLFLPYFPALATQQARNICALAEPPISIYRH